MTPILEAPLEESEEKRGGRANRLKKSFSRLAISPHVFTRHSY